MSATAVVFAHGDVGVRGLAVLLARGVDVPLVVGHCDPPHEAGAFASVAAFARAKSLEVITPEDVNEPTIAARVAALRPEFVFSFYCRQMLGMPILAAARRGALNVHGSLLPRYRGRAPINWAVIRGETQTGATLHHMTAKADAGDIVDQQAVPILPDDTAFDVFRKVVCAAEIVLWRSLPALIDGNAPRRPQNPAAASYFGRRRPEDGRIDWSADAKTIHDLVRGVAPPYPGAFAVVHGRVLKILRSAREEARHAVRGRPLLSVEAGGCFIQCGGGGVLRVLEAEVDGRRIAPEALHHALGIPAVHPLHSEELIGS